MPKYTKRKDGRYATHVVIGTKPDGKPLRRTVYARTIRDLEIKAAELRRQVGLGTLSDDGGITLGEWATQWVKIYKTGIGHSSLEVYEISLRAHIIPAIGHLKLKDVKPFHIQGLANSMSEKGLTRATEKAIMTIKQFLKRAVENGLIPKNPADNIEMPKKQKKQKRALTENERQVFEKADLPLIEKAFLYILMYAGLRRGEILALEWGDVDMEEKTISISKAWTVQGNKGVIKQSPKTKAGNRTIPMTQKMFNVLLDFSKTGQDGFLFPSPSKNPMTLSEFRAFWGNILTSLKSYTGELASDITPHIFRHTYATMLFYAGVDIKTAQYLLGHSSIAVTMEIYTHLDKSKINLAVNKLDEYISSSQ